MKAYIDNIEKTDCGVRLTLFINYKHDCSIRPLTLDEWQQKIDSIVNSHNEQLQKYDQERNECIMQRNEIHALRLGECQLLQEHFKPELLTITKRVQVSKQDDMHEATAED